MNARQKIVDQIERLAQSAFANHSIRKITEDGVIRHYECRKSGTGTYGFNISTIPGRLIVTGDVGSLLVERTNDMFEWTPIAVESIDYFAEKVISEIGIKTFDRDVAFEFLAEEQVAEGTESKRAMIASELEDYLHSEFEFKSALHESGLIDGCDWPDLENWKPNFLWCREAVRWFFRNKTENRTGKTE